MNVHGITIWALAAMIPGVGVAQPMPAEGSDCRAERAPFAIGKPYSDELVERARVVGRIEPGGAYTMDLQPTRLNIEVDRQEIVQDVSCG